MKILYFTHSLRSCWNHGNAHFLRGVMRELIRRGHEVVACEPEHAWSLGNLLADHGEAGLDAFERSYPDLRSITYRTPIDADKLCAGVDVVIVHEWTDPDVVGAVGRARRAGGGFTLLFHDTHHRAVSDPAAIHAFDLADFDGILAFGEALSEVYRGWGWGNRVFTWHEAADLRLFKPPAGGEARHGLVWIGNWGDGERGAELETFLLAPAAEVGLPLEIYGVRYPPDALAMLARYGAGYRGWLPNARAPEIFAARLATVHVPRRFYVEKLPGIPTIRVFEALACGIPLVSSPWDDAEHLFRPGEDYLVARDGAEMGRHLRALRDDPALRDALVENGLARIRGRHSCAHRVDELLTILKTLRAASPRAFGTGPLQESAS
jgi:spore maturation protein CgeB